MKGAWLPPGPREHRCRQPFLIPFRVRIGDRWRCEARIHPGIACGKVWRVTMTLSRSRAWSEEGNPTALKVFRPVTDAHLWYWIVQDLNLQTQDEDVSAETLVEVIQKHFEIGSRS